MTPVASSSIREVAIELMHVLRLSLVTQGTVSSCRKFRRVAK